MISYLKQGWLVLALAVLFGAALAGINSTLNPIISENELNEINGQVANLVPGADGAKTQMNDALSEATALQVREAINADNKLVGWVVRASGQGYADKIDVLIGLNAKADTITGIYILSQKETPGLGSKITSSWNEQYIGKKISPPLTVVKGKGTKENDIDAISGATISSTSLTNIVNAALETFHKALVAKDRTPVSTQPAN